MAEIQGPNETSQTSLQITEDTPLMKKMAKMFLEAKSEREKVSQHWEHYYRMWATDQWHDIHVDEWRSRPQVNFIFSTVELETATITDQDPQLVVYPRHNEEGAFEVAEVLNKIYEHSWRKTKGKLALKNGVRNSRIYGTGFLKGGWNSDKKNISIHSIPPDQIYPDPSALDVEDAWYLFHVYDVSINDIIHNWPDKAGQVRPGLITDIGQFDRGVWSSDEENSPLGGLGRLTHTEGASTHTTIVKIREGSSVKIAEGQVTLIEFWEKDPKSGEITLHYIANDVLLDSIKNPLGDKIKRFPFVKIINTPVDGEFWGMSTVQALEPIQLSINKRRQQIIDNLRILGNPPILADKSAGLEEDLVLGAPGEIVSVNDGARVDWLRPPAMPQGIFQLQQLDKSEFETISGMFDVVQGRTPSGIEAAAAIAELQEAAQTRVRDKVSLMESALEELGDLLLLIIQSNYTEEQALMLLGKEGALEEVVINAPLTSVGIMDANEEEGNRLADLDAVQRALDITKGGFDIQIKVGSTLPLQKTARLNEAILLFDRGLIDHEEVLTAISHPRKREILARVAQMQQQAPEQAQPGEGQLPPGLENMNLTL